MVSATVQIGLASDPCRQCKIDRPTYVKQNTYPVLPLDMKGTPRFWTSFACSRCGSVAFTCMLTNQEEVLRDWVPTIDALDTSIPERARAYLRQAIETIHAPTASIIVSTSAVDAMLKSLGYAKGKLYPRIKQAADDGRITWGMERWAHKLRLDANAQRHADLEAGLPTEQDAKVNLHFALVLADFLFAHPEMTSNLVTPQQRSRF